MGILIAGIVLPAYIVCSIIGIVASVKQGRMGSGEPAALKWRLVGFIFSIVVSVLLIYYLAQHHMPSGEADGFKFIILLGVLSAIIPIIIGVASIGKPNFSAGAFFSAWAVLWVAIGISGSA